MHRMTKQIQPNSYSRPDLVGAGGTCPQALMSKDTTDHTKCYSSICLNCFRISKCYWRGSPDAQWPCVSLPPLSMPVAVPLPNVILYLGPRLFEDWWEKGGKKATGNRGRKFQGRPSSNLSSLITIKVPRRTVAPWLPFTHERIMNQHDQLCKRILFATRVTKKYNSM